MMMKLEIQDDSRLVKMLDRNHSYLQEQYRLGQFEGRIDYVHTWQPARLFYELGAEKNQPKAGDIDFFQAVDNFYGLIQFVERERPQVSRTQATLVLRSKIIIYEAFDYFLHVPDELEEYFDQKARHFAGHPRSEDMEQWARQEFNQGNPFACRDEETKVIKDLLIAVLLGVNSYIRQHSHKSYSNALDILEKVHRYVEEDLPLQHQQERQSLGLLGLTLYLKGRTLMAQGRYEECRKAFRESAEAYVNRLRQKEEFLRQGKITKDAFIQKTSVTLRRAALVTAFGDGYLSFISSQINRALESLTLARATLTQNSGRVYLAYVDMWYWACQRAKHSSDERLIDDVIEGLTRCHDTLFSLVKNSRYRHRAGVELALAIYYKSKLSPQDTDDLLDEAEKFLNSAIDYAKVLKGKDYKNPHLFGDALIYQSYFKRARFRSQWKDKKSPDDLKVLMEALEVAEAACEVSEKQGTDPLKSEAWAARGAVYTDLVNYRKELGEDFTKDFEMAYHSLRRALKWTGGNPRLDAACYLRLSKLCLLNEKTVSLGHDYFEQWRKLESNVEHAYLKEMARDLEVREKLDDPFFLVKPGETLEYAKWEKELVDKLHEAAMRKFISTLPADSKKTLGDKTLKARFGKFMHEEIGYSTGKVNGLLNHTDLFSKLKEMIMKSPTTDSKTGI